MLLLFVMIFFIITVNQGTEVDPNSDALPINGAPVRKKSSRRASQPSSLRHEGGGCLHSGGCGDMEEGGREGGRLERKWERNGGRGKREGKCE